jgi:hypothetical protein
MKMNPSQLNDLRDYRFGDDTAICSAWLREVGGSHNRFGEVGTLLQKALHLSYELCWRSIRPVSRVYRL